MLLKKSLLKHNISPAAAMFARSSQMVRDGVDLICANIGEPDFPIPSHIHDATVAAVRDGPSGYIISTGLPQLRQAVADKITQTHGVACDIENVVITTGARQAIFAVLYVSLESQDEVIVPDPQWNSHADISHFLDAHVVRIPTNHEQSYRISPQQLEDAITPKTKWLVLCNPHNPTGTVYSPSHLKSLAKVLERHPHVYVMSDEIYEDFVFDDAEWKSIAAVCPSLKERLVIINGWSKSYAMTGWRLGYVMAPAHVITAVTLFLTNSLGSLVTPMQQAGIAALEGNQSSLERNRATLSQNRDKVLPLLRKIPGLKVFSPLGAMYVFMDCAQWINSTVTHEDGSVTALNDDEIIAQTLLEKYHLALSPGCAFGSTPALRMSLTCDPQCLEQACHKLEMFARSLR